MSQSEYAQIIGSLMHLMNYEKHLEGGWIGVSANLELNAKLSALNAEANANVAQT